MPPQLSKPIQTIRSVQIPGKPSTWDVTIGYPPDAQRGIITSITPHNRKDATTDTTTFATNTVDGNNNSPLLLPSLTHPHIHLDKAFIHNSPIYTHLYPRSGSFAEALSNTAQAKSTFHLNRSDLLRRGEWLLSESLAAGVTSIRAFVEVDETVGTTCLEVGLDLKRRWAGVCQIQIVCFAQDPVFSFSSSGTSSDSSSSSPHHRVHNNNGGNANMDVIERALSTRSLVEGIDVLGTTPYVEDCYENARRNVEWAFNTAMEKGLHLDFHLDYNLDPNKGAMVWDIVSALSKTGWTRAMPAGTHGNDIETERVQTVSGTTQKKVMLGHCTRLTIFSAEEWKKLASIIHHTNLPLSFVGLPTSDLYMASPPRDNNMQTSQPGLKQRGSLNVPDMIISHGLDAVIGVNNVGNAFTPWGKPDPLCLACLGVGLYQLGTQEGAELLYQCISTRARAAIGIDNSLSTGVYSSSPILKEGDPADFLLLYNLDETGLGMSRGRSSVAEVVWDPPSTPTRDVITAGRLVVKPMAAERAQSSPETCFVHI